MKKQLLSNCKKMSPLATDDWSHMASGSSSDQVAKEQLLDGVADKENTLFQMRNDYEQEYDRFFKIAKKFHLEKLNNLKLQFKNQILKQRIYFETELLEISRECHRDYEKTGSRKHVRKNEREKQLIKLYKADMKRLIEYMKEALLNSSDTLMEAFETCKVLKSLEQVEKNAQKQNANLKNSTKNLLSYKSFSTSNNENVTSGESQGADKSFNLTVLNEDDEEKSGLDGANKLTEDQIQFNKYQCEMDELMHVLDDIELQHLQRKDQLNTKTKFVNKLKSKFKFVESKYEMLSKQITNLKYESFVYKELWEEKQRSVKTASRLGMVFRSFFRLNEFSRGSLIGIEC